MKKITLAIFVFCSLFVTAQNIYIHQPSTIDSYAISNIDSIIFNNSGTDFYFYKNGTSFYTKSVAQTDSLNFQYGSVWITFNGTTASVINPFAGKGVEVTISNADVTVNSTLAEEINYIVTGTTTDGCVKFYSANRFILSLNSTQITNVDGAAINIQSSKKTNLRLIGTNKLADGTTYATTTEDMKSTLFSEGQIVFEGSGSLEISSVSNHAICSDDYLAINSGTIKVTAAGKDGIHVNDYVKINGGTLTISSTGDGIDCGTGYFEINDGQVTVTSTATDVKAIKCDSIMTFNGGTVNLTVTGAQSKGLSSNHNMFFNGGTIIAKMSGAVAIVSGDPSYCTAIKCDRNVTVNGGSITITSSSAGGRGFSCDSSLFVYGGTLNITMTGNGATYTNASNVTDSYCAAAIKCDANINIIGGKVTTNTSGTGGKGLSANGTINLGASGYTPIISITTSGTKFAVSSSSGAGPGGGTPPGGSNTDYCLPKAIKADGDITVNSGTITISSADDGCKSETSFTMNGGDMTISKSVEGIEGPLITMNGGVLKVVASDDAINATKGTVSGGTESNDGSWFYMKGGIVSAASTAADVIDSNGSAQMTGGVLIINCQSSQPEEPIDCNGGFTLTGGTIAVSAKTTISLSSSSQSYLSISSSSISTSTYVQVLAGGVEQVVFKPKYSSLTKFLVSGTGMKKGTAYQIYTGGSYSGGTSVDGCYFTGGTYSGGTLKKSGTLSSSSTSNSVSL